jgi:magnesium chelatase family protein
VQRYTGKISGPILDRIDLRVEVTTPPAEKLGCAADRDTTRHLHDRVTAARERQALRFAEVPGVHCNAQAGPDERRAFARARREATDLLRRAVTRWNLSVRAYERTLAVARSIADLDGASDVDAHHVAEALQYRLDSTESR